jgi:phage tail-like protein
VKWDGRYVPGISRVSGLVRSPAPVERREGGDSSAPRWAPGRTRFYPLVLERGLTHDEVFERWANKVWALGAGLGAEASLKGFRRDIVLEVYNEAGQLVKAYRVYRCWPSRHVAVSDLNANGERVACEVLTLHHEGWERDPAVAEPDAPWLGK